MLFLINETSLFIFLFNNSTTWSGLIARFLEAELNNVRNQGEKELEKIRVKLEEDSEIQAKRLLDQASNAIELEMNKALSEIQDEASKIAVDLAEDILKKNLKEDDQGRLSQQYLDNITDTTRR